MPDPGHIKVLAFDVFGTVVDWHASIAAEVEQLALPGVDSADFARRWRAGYRPAMDRVAKGELPWMNIDQLHRMILDAILVEQGVCSLTPDQTRHLNRAWHRLTPWPDTCAGLERLRSRYTVCTLSNGNIGLLANMAKHANMRWDCILSAETFRAYKPEPAAYLGVAQVFDVSPSEVMMVAAHQDDLAAARSCGLKTAYIERPHEFGLGIQKDVHPEPANDFHATDLLQLANLLGC